MSDDDNKTIKIEHDPDTGNVLVRADQVSGDSEVLDIAQNIGNIIGNVFRNFSDEWLEEFREKIKAGDYQSAYDVFYENRDRLVLTKKDGILDDLRTMDVQKLCSESRKEFLLTLLGYVGLRRAWDDTYIKEADALLDEFEDEIEPEIKLSILQEKGNASARAGRNNQAAMSYKKVIASEEAGPEIVAWSYRGLYMIAETQENQAIYMKKSADKFLEAGIKVQAIKDFIGLSDLHSASDPSSALKYLDEAIALQEGEEILDQVKVASILFRKVGYLSQLERPDEALQVSEEVCRIREQFAGNEAETASSYMMASRFAKVTGDNEKAALYREKADSLTPQIKNDAFLTRLEFADQLEQQTIIDDDVLRKAEGSGDSVLLSSILIMRAISDDLSPEKSLELLDRARLIEEKQRDKQLLCKVHHAIGEVYRKEELVEDALKNYEKALSLNEFNQASMQNCIFMLFKHERWEEAEKFIKSRLDIHGEKLGICYVYAKALLKNRNYSLALKYFKKTDQSTEGLQDLMTECVVNMTDKEIQETRFEPASKVQSISIQDFRQALNDISSVISANSRMHFWKFDKDKKKYEWVSKPEERAKHILLACLAVKFGEGAIELLQEPRAGAGFIDLYVCLAGDTKIVIELKMCGAGYSSSYAISGEDQVIHYLENKPTNIGFLVVFDGRVRDYAKGFKETQTIGADTIYTVAVDMRNKIKD